MPHSVFTFGPTPSDDCVRLAKAALSHAAKGGLGLYEAAVVKGISVVFSDLDSLWLRMLCAVKPRSREAVRRRRRA